MKTMYELSVITARSPRRLSWMHGFEGPHALASSLPENAVVVDVGTGNSKFGRAITGLREDVNWLNVDLYFGRRGAHRWRQRHSPPNLNYVAGDALRLPFKPGSVDRVFSSALLPHIVMSDWRVACNAVHGMASLLKEDGILSIASFGGDAELVTAEEYQSDPNAAARRVVGEMTLDPTCRRTQEVINTALHYTGMTAVNRLIGY